LAVRSERRAVACRPNLAIVSYLFLIVAIFSAAAAMSSGLPASNIVRHDVMRSVIITSAENKPAILSTVLLYVGV